MTTHTCSSSKHMNEYKQLLDLHCLRGDADKTYNISKVPWYLLVSLSSQKWTVSLLGRVVVWGIRVEGREEEGGGGREGEVREGVATFGVWFPE